MTLSLELKQRLHQQLISILNGKMDAIHNSIMETSESMQNDTKSSAGDKFETGREMMQMELNNQQVQLNKLKQQLADLSKVNLQIESTVVEFGSLVQTSLGDYYVSVALGKVELDIKSYFTLSLASPIGQALKNKKAGEQVKFQGRTVEIISMI